MMDCMKIMVRIVVYSDAKYWIVNGSISSVMFLPLRWLICEIFILPK